MTYIQITEITWGINRFVLSPSSTQFHRSIPVSAYKYCSLYIERLCFSPIYFLYQLLMVVKSSACCDSKVSMFAPREYNSVLVMWWTHICMIHYCNSMNAVYEPCICAPITQQTTQTEFHFSFRWTGVHQCTLFATVNSVVCCALYYRGIPQKHTPHSICFF